MRKIFIGLFALFLLGLFYLYNQALKSQQSYSVAPSVMEKVLAPCPDSPNCVSSQSSQADKRRNPLPFTGQPAQAMERLKALVLAMPRTKLVGEEVNYLHFTFTTWPIPFVDDVEFLLDEAAACIHFRSASRVGYSDLGANSKRMGKVAELWQSTQ